MSVRLDDIDLSTRKGNDGQGAINEIRSIMRLGVTDRRRMVEHRTACSHGSIITDRGRTAIRISIEGAFIGEGAKQSMALLSSKYNAGQPLAFASTITMLMQIDKVLLEELHVYTLSGLQNHYGYRIILREYNDQERSQDSTAPTSQEGEAEAEVRMESNMVSTS